MSDKPNRFDRRDVLKTGGMAVTLGTVGLAGCTGSEGDGDSGGSSDSGSDDSSDSSSDDSSMDSGAESMEISVAYASGPESKQAQAVKSEFIDRVESDTDGRITFNFEAGTLGGSEDILDATQGGSVDMVLESPEATATRFAPGYTFAGDPFVMRDVDHYRNVEQEFLLTEDGLNGELVPQGLRMFQGFRWGNRGVTANKPVRTPEDVQGVQMRLPQFDSWVGVWEEIGVSVTPVAFDELYSALETGVAEASEGPITQFMDTSLYEVQTDFSDTKHLLSMHAFIMNEEFYQGLSSEDREYMEMVMQEAANDINEALVQGEQEDFEAARDEGTTITEASEIDREAFVEAAQPYLETLAEEEWEVGLDEIQAL